MNDAPLLDTHAWVWWVGRAQRLGQKLVAALDALPADRRPYLSDISLWEVAMLAERARVSLTLPLPEWLEPRPIREPYGWWRLHPQSLPTPQHCQRPFTATRQTGLSSQPAA